jgi:hypothetical protein
MDTYDDDESASSLSEMGLPGFDISTSSRFGVEVTVGGLRGVGAGEVFANFAATAGGSCKACFIASSSVRGFGGAGECNRGGRGGGGVRKPEVMSISLGGGGRGPAVA